MRAWVRRLATYWKDGDIRARMGRWRDRRGVRAFWVRHLGAAALTARAVEGIEMPLRAAALTYRTLLALVPTLALAFAVFGAFGGLARLRPALQRLLAENLAAGRSGEVTAWLDRFIENFDVGGMAGIGLVALVYTAIGLLADIESSIDRTWELRSRRPFFRRVTAYWTLITLVPPLVAFSISLSARLESSAFAEAARDWLPLGLGRLALSATTLAALLLAFTSTYLIMPNARVPLRAAVAGGAVAAVAWQVLKWGFIELVASSVRYDAVYGALGTLPVVMIWMYLGWIVVLAGARYAYEYASILGLLPQGPSPAGNPPEKRVRVEVRVRSEVPVELDIDRGES